MIIDILAFSFMQMFPFSYLLVTRVTCVCNLSSSLKSRGWESNSNDRIWYLGSAQDLAGSQVPAQSMCFHFLCVSFLSPGCPPSLFLSCLLSSSFLEPARLSTAECCCHEPLVSSFSFPTSTLAQFNCFPEILQGPGPSLETTGSLAPYSGKHGIETL